MCTQIFQILTLFVTIFLGCIFSSLGELAFVFPGLAPGLGLLMGLFVGLLLILILMGDEVLLCMRGGESRNSFSLAARGPNAEIEIVEINNNFKVNFV